MPCAKDRMWAEQYKSVVCWNSILALLCYINTMQRSLSWFFAFLTLVKFVKFSKFSFSLLWLSVWCVLWCSCGLKMVFLVCNTMPASTIRCASCSFEWTLQTVDVLLHLISRLTVFPNIKVDFKITGGPLSGSETRACRELKLCRLHGWLSCSLAAAATWCGMLQCHSTPECGPLWPSCHKPCVCFKLRFPPLGLDDNCCCDRYEVRLESCLQLWFRFTSLLTLHSAMCNVHTSPQVQLLFSQLDE